MTITKKIWSLLASHQRRILIILLAAILINSVLEALNIGLIFPLIKLVGNPDLIQNYPILLRIGAFFGLTNPRDILILLVSALLALFVFKSIYIVGLTRFQLRFVSNFLYSVSTRLLRVYLYSPWTFHLKTNSADLLNNIINRVGLLCTGLLGSLFVLCIESLVIISIVIVLILVDPVSTFIAVSLIGITSFVFLYFIRHRIKKLGNLTQTFYASMIKSANEAFGGIKETKVLGRENYFIKSYTKNIRGYTRSWIYITFISQLQRTIVESLVVGGIIIMALIILMRGQDVASLMPILALFAAAAFRLMPSINRVNTAVTTIKFHYPALDVVYSDINLISEIEMRKKDGTPSITNELVFNEKIELKNISFRYPDAKSDALRNISLSIPKGNSIAFIGPSGAGKTSLVDIILGLLNPTSGKVEVDGQDIKGNLDSWRRQIGYIPQFIYLSDNTIRNNVAFGLDDDKIDDQEVWKALKYAQLEKFVRKLPDGLDTIVGEHGARLSGGELQRVGIARALYHDPKILVLDEATSHLDMKTEREIMNTIEALKGEKTLVIITHRLSTVKNCDIKYTIKSGKKIKTTYNQHVAI